eukprot:7093201-Prymnesium_polylepis.1
MSRDERRTKRDRACESGGFAPKHGLAAREEQERIGHTAANTAKGGVDLVSSGLPSAKQDVLE